MLRVDRRCGVEGILVEFVMLSRRHLVLAFGLLALTTTGCSGSSDEELEPLFKSAEGYLRTWEKAELRGATLRGEAQSERP